MIGILTVNEDIHALAVMRELTRRSYTECRIIPVNKIRTAYQLSIKIGVDGARAKITMNDGSEIQASDIDVLWLRRPRADQLDTPENELSSTSDLINNECRGAMSGLLGTSIQGRWISPMEATIRASDKIVQLNTALSCGFRIPETLVSQSQQEIIEFYEKF